LANPRLNQALASWQSWPIDLDRPPSVIEELSGFTNQSVVLDANDQRLVLRLNRIGADVLGIYRQQEYRIWQSVADLGIAPRLLYTDPKGDFVIYPYIDGRVWTAEDLAKPGQTERLRNRINEYKDTRLDLPPRNYINYLHHYWNQLENTAATTPEIIDQWQAFQPELNSLQHSDWTPVLVHHDLIPENIIDTGQALYIVDWEYAAMGHPELDWCCFCKNENHPINQVVDWINRLWWLLVNNQKEQI
jgi:thiamine kinase